MKSIRLQGAAILALVMFILMPFAVLAESSIHVLVKNLLPRKSDGKVFVYKNPDTTEGTWKAVNWPGKEMSGELLEGRVKIKLNGQETYIDSVNVEYSSPGLLPSTVPEPGRRETLGGRGLGD